MRITRRQLLATLPAGTAAIAAPSIIRAQTRAAPSSARDRLEEALRRIADPAGEGVRACLTVYPEVARAAADASDARARAGMSLSPLDGAIVTIKDLFDVRGEPTRAGSRVLADAPTATDDALIVRRLRAAGAVIVAKTAMVEFAFGGGLNRHYGTPGNPADRTRIPGGSSSGAGVAVADGMCEIGIGTDTAASVRMPAAFCGVVGFKPSQFRIPTNGAYPLSYSLDSVGPLARNVADCARADAVLAGDEPWTLDPAPLAGLRLAIPAGRLIADLDPTVTARFAEATDRLRRAGVRVSDEAMPVIDAIVPAGRPPLYLTIIGAEAYAIHRERFATRASEYEPGVRARLEGASGISAADYIVTMRQRAALVRAMDARLTDFDGLVLPTVPIVAPRIADVADVAAEDAVDTRFLIRNTVIANVFDLCAISLPLPRQGGLPVGLMLVARNGEDRRLLRMAAAVEKLFAA